jgi:hypothetical protein
MGYFVIIKKISYTLLPIIIILILDGSDGWKGWDRFILDFKKSKTEAEIIENPFYHLVKSEPSDDLFSDNDALLNFVSKSGKEYIKFRYFDYDKKEFIDSVRYKYRVEYGGNKEEGDFYNEEIFQYSLFAEEIINKPKGYKFDVYFFKNNSIPVSVYNGVLSETGKFKIYLQNAFIELMVFAIIMSLCIGISQFNSKV